MKGRVVEPRGYVLLRMPGHHLADCRGYVYEHRLLAEATLGRRLLKGEQVHHKNECKSDNADGNLQVTGSLKEHAGLHAAARVQKAGGDPLTQKRCSRCKTVKNFSEFGPRNHRCRSCSTEHHRDLRRRRRC